MKKNATENISSHIFSKLFNIFSINNILLLFLVILIGIAMRWIGLTTRVFHHDESLYAVYGNYFFQDPYSKFYRYKAILHGPLLFHLLHIVYKIFGVNEWSARFLSASLGTSFIFFPFSSLR